MPTYGYRCISCETKFERVQKMSDPPVTTCESCGGAVKKILYPVGIAFKGSGFYVNDYKPSSGDKNKSKDNNSGETAATETKTENTPADAKTESKSETKTETKTESATTPAPAASSSDKPAN